MMYVFATILLSLICVILAYAWILYPRCVIALQAGRHTAAHVPQHKPTLPNIVILIAARNEAAVIATRLRNLDALAYPADKINVLIGADGCTDDTVALARTAAQSCRLKIEIVVFPVNRGKASVLVDLVARARAQEHAGELLLVFTDANTQFLPDTLTQLAAPFQDPRIGGVCGRLIFADGNNRAEQDYWNWETRLKQAEAHFDSCLGANGAVYAMRPVCFWQDLPPQTIIDDFVLGMKVREAGLRMYFAPDAIAMEDLPEQQQEWHRRIRIGSGAYQAVYWCRASLHPRFGRFALFFWSHKILRWFTPHLLLAATAAAIVALLAQPTAWHYTRIMHLAFLSGCLLLAGITAIDLLLPPTRRPGNRTARRILRAGSHFVIMQAALMAGFLRFCRGNLSGTWNRTPRKDPP